MDKVFLKRICEKYFEKFYKDCEIKNFLVLDTFSLNEDTGKWYENNGATIFIVLNFYPKYVYSDTIEKTLESLTGCEICIST